MIKGGQISVLFMHDKSISHTPMDAMPYLKKKTSSSIKKKHKSQRRKAKREMEEHGERGPTSRIWFTLH
jgi:hypothetical protein